MTTVPYQKLIATYAFRIGHGNNEGVIRKGDWFHAPPTGQMSRTESMQCFIAQGAGRLPKKDEVEGAA